MNFSFFRKASNLVLVLISPSGQKVEIPPVSSGGVEYAFNPSDLDSRYDNYRFEGTRIISGKACHTVKEYKEAPNGDGGISSDWSCW